MAQIKTNKAYCVNISVPSFSQTWSSKEDLLIFSATVTDIGEQWIYFIWMFRIIPFSCTSHLIKHWIDKVVKIPQFTKERYMSLINQSNMQKNVSEWYIHA